MIPVDILLEKGAILKQYSIEETIFEEGSSSQFYYQVLSGRVRICNYSDEGKEVLHRLVGKGECFGEVSIFEDASHIATAVADSTCQIYRLGKHAFLGLLKEYPEYHYHFLEVIARNLRFKMFLTTLMSVGSPERILLRLIHHLNHDSKMVCPNCKRLMLTRQQLANMTGLRVETVIRTLKHLEKEDKLNIRRGKVFVPADGLH